MDIQKEWITNQLSEAALTQIKEFSKDIATSDKHPKKGYSFRNDLKTSQLRKFYGEVKSIQSNGIVDSKSAFLMLKPKLAYAVGRANKNNKIEKLYTVISQASDAIDIDHCEDEKELKKRYNNFVQLFEAIVAYHKFYGGQDN